MREGQYEIIVLDDRDRPLTEEVISDRSFVTAQPGSSYHVKINVYRNKSGQFPAKYLRLGLYVDGNDVQYWKRLDLSDQSERHSSHCCDEERFGDSSQSDDSLLSVGRYLCR
jgi:hypothetical protein